MVLSSMSHHRSTSKMRHNHNRSWRGTDPWCSSVAAALSHDSESTLGPVLNGRLQQLVLKRWCCTMVVIVYNIADPTDKSRQAT